MTSSSKEVKKIYFFTSNKRKLEEVNDLLGSHPKFEVSFFCNFYIPFCFYVLKLIAKDIDLGKLIDKNI
jgi:inosine/xanthosine triphosphate pyrophosphatase family protein